MPIFIGGKKNGDEMCDKRKDFEREYSVTFMREKKFLDMCGIKYTFVKNIDGVTTYKYKKNSRLFDCLSKFYGQFENNA